MSKAPRRAPSLGERVALARKALAELLDVDTLAALVEPLGNNVQLWGHLLVFLVEKPCSHNGFDPSKLKLALEKLFARTVEVNVRVEQGRRVVEARGEGLELKVVCESGMLGCRVEKAVYGNSECKPGVIKSMLKGDWSTCTRFALALAYSGFSPMDCAPSWTVEVPREALARLGVRIGGRISEYELEEELGARW